MIRIVSPSLCEVHKGNGKARSYAKIKFEDGRLSITGVVGPMSNGNCRGSAGQCVDEIRKGEPANGWTEEMLDKFCDIWDEWHLNDMKPYCQHMKEMGWADEASQKVRIETWTLTDAARTKRREAEKRAMKCLWNGEPFFPTKEETMYSKLEHEIKVYNGEDISRYTEELPSEAYEFKETNCLGWSNVEYKTRGWIRHTEHPLGFIGRPCPVCEYEYGTKWLKEEVPSEVIEFLFSLPESKTIPAWI